MLAGLLVLAGLLLAAWGPAVAAQAAPSGTGPDDALAVTGEWQQIGPGASRWYAFDYAGDGSQVQVRLEVYPEEGVTLAVWTPDGIRRRGLGLEADPVGRGSAGADNVLSWAGNFTIPGTYYLVVAHAGQPGPASYRLTVEGAGVSVAAPEPEATPKPAPTRTPAKAQGKIAGRLVFQTTVGGPFYTINADGSGLRRITDGIDPVWSPDGERIAFVRWREPRGVWVVELDGSGAPANEWRAFDWSETRWPSWSPDGSEILFSRQYGGRQNPVERCFFGFCFTFPAHPHWKLGVVGAGGEDFREPPSSDYSLGPDWAPPGAPNSDRIVYADEQGLRVQSFDGTVSYLITDDSRDTAPVWSPDGSRVAFTRRQHDHWEVYVVDADGRNLKRLTHTPVKANGEVGHSAAPAWSPDGQYLAFLTDRLGQWEIWVMRANGGGLKPMFPGGLEGLRLEYGHIGDRAISWTE